MAGSGS